MTISLCYSCVDQVQFQLYGQTQQYWKNQKEHSEKYIERYEAEGRPVIVCDLCCRKVWYVPTEDGKWNEHDEEEAEQRDDGVSIPVQIELDNTPEDTVILEHMIETIEKELEEHESDLPRPNDGRNSKGNHGVD